MANIHNELRGYQVISRDLIFDNSMSDRARFVYVYMASKPDGWDFLLEPMAKEIGYSKDTLRKYINELVENGWLVKGEQINENGQFGAVEYTIKATKFSDTEKTRHGKNPTLIKKENDKENKENNKEKEIIKESQFDECWVAYRRKGSKKKAKEQWMKLKMEEIGMVMPHIKAYVATRELVYQKDFERYIRDRTFMTAVFKGNTMTYDPTTHEKGTYQPATDGAIKWDDKNQCYIYISMFFGYIPDGYDDDNRPDGATIMLNNSCKRIRWNATTKQWEEIVCTNTK